MVLHCAEKMAGIQQAAARMLPTHQRLDALHSALLGANIDLRQVFEHQFVFGQGALEFAQGNRRSVLEIGHQQLFDTERHQRPGRDSDDLKPMRLRSASRAGEHPRMHGAYQQRRRQGALLGQNSQHGKPVDIEAVHRQHRHRGSARREDGLQTLRRISFDAIAAEACGNRAQGAQGLRVRIEDQQ